jgi:dCTP deaminase
LGKSTYARCFRGDTKVALVDGTSISLEDMARRADKGEEFWGYSIGAYGRIIVSHLQNPRYIGRDSLLEITLDNQEKIRCTPDHEFIRRDGCLVQAGDLKPNDALMPLYRQDARGYEQVYQPLNGFHIPTHKLADEWNLRHAVYDEMENSHRHHLDHNKSNNNPWNIQRLAASEHIKHHNQRYYGEGFDAKHHSEAIKASLSDNAKSEKWRKNYSEQQSLRAKNFWHDDEYAEQREALLEKRQNTSEETREKHRIHMQQRFTNPEERVHQSERMKTAWKNSDNSRREKQAEFAANLNKRHDIDAERVLNALKKAGSIRGAARMLECDRSVFRRFPDVMNTYHDEKVTTGAYKNHKVLSIKALAGDHDVYCLTVPEAGNFALESGVFVKNCGIIVNVTPLEPEWEGHVTLEFSNTTPLPAKIYANEGVAQMLFFESAEVCETSYKDRNGKYQGQRGVTLPQT